MLSSVTQPVSQRIAATLCGLSRHPVARDPSAQLPPRLTQTLAALAEGCSEQEVSQRLGISRHTVHNYVKALHHRLGVASRGELLAKVSQAQTPFLPRFIVPE